MYVAIDSQWRRIIAVRKSRCYALAVYTGGARVSQCQKKLNFMIRFENAIASA